jgi:hypothetical protein
MILRLIFIAVASAGFALAAENDQLPAERRVNWTAGTHTGVPGGIPARTDPTKIIDVTQSPYFAAGTNAETTGDMTNGSYDVTVADPSSFLVGHRVRVGRVSIQTLVLSGSANSSGTMRVRIGGMVATSDQDESAFISVTSGETAEVVAAKVRAAASSYAGWNVGGSGGTVIFTHYTLGHRLAGQIDNTRGLTAGWTQTQTGTVTVTAATITGIAGNVLTLSAAATADVTGAIVSHNDAPAIQAAVTAAGAQYVVYLPAGTYRIDSEVGIGTNDDNITLRGAGMNSTILDVRGNKGISMGSSGDYNYGWPVSGNTVTAGLTKGSTSITIDGSTAFNSANGSMVVILYENQTDTAAILAGATPTASTSGFLELRKQVTRLTANAASNVLSIFPPVYFTPDAGLSAKVVLIQAQTDFSGVENLTVDGTRTRLVSPITYEQTYGCWITGCKVVWPRNYGTQIASSLGFEQRGNYLTPRIGGGTNGAGFWTYVSAGGLIEDNISVGIFPATEINASTMGTVVAYNVFENEVGGTMNVNHAPHNSFNLYEGNITPNFQSDGYFGGASEDTFYRNWLHGTNQARTLRTFMASLNRWSWNYSMIGNIFGEKGMARTGTTSYSFGNPYMGSGSDTGTTVDSSLGTIHSQWNATAELTTRTSDTAGQLTMASGFYQVGGLVYLRWGTGLTSRSGTSFTGVVTAVSGNLVTVSGGTLPALNTIVNCYMGPLEYGERDGNVERTALLKANFAYRVSGIPSGESIGSDTLPASLFRTSKPSYFGDLNWPPFDSSEEDAITGEPEPDFGDIPAGARYLTILGEPEPTPTVATPSFTPSSTTHSTPQTIYAASATSGATFYYTLDNTTPTTGSLLYNDGVGIPLTYGTTVLKMYGVKDGHTDSAVRSATYAITAEEPSGGTATIQTLNVNGTLNIAAP